jgi:hypothetical protein
MVSQRCKKHPAGQNLPNLAPWSLPQGSISSITSSQWLFYSYNLDTKYQHISALAKFICWKHDAWLLCVCFELSCSWSEGKKME